MAYTLSKFLNDTPIQGIIQLTDCQYIDKINIDSISVQELPFDDFIQKNELVLTTAIGCDKDPGLFHTMISSAIKANAAAIFMAFKKDIYIPEEVLQLATDHQLPVFQIPWEYRFSEIQVSVIKSIEQEKVARWKVLQGHLFNMFFDGDSLENVCKFIEEELETFLCLTDSYHKIIYRSFERENSIVDTSSSVNAEIHVGKDLCAYLNMTCCKMLKSQDRELLVQKYLAFPLSFWFNQQNQENFLKEKMKNDFVCNLLHDNLVYVNLVQDGRDLNFDITLPYICIVMCMEWQDNEKEKYSSAVMELSKKIEKKLLETAPSRIMLGHIHNSYIIFLEITDDNFETNLHKYIQDLDQEISLHHKNLKLCWGISDTNKNTLRFRESYQEAKISIRYAENLNTSTRIYYYGDTRNFMIISALHKNTDVKKAAEKLLLKLYEYDQKSTADLMNTLVEYIRNNYCISETARTLHIHRQSLLYRLEKIEQLTGMSLNDYNNLFTLQVYTRLYINY